MKVLINALSVTNSSGRHVLLGHLSRFAEWTRDRHEFVVLHHNKNHDLCRDLGGNVEFLACPASTAGWVGRAWWERTSLPALVREGGFGGVYSPAGTVTSGLEIPQISFAQNPWALVRGLNRSLGETLKALLQRVAYREAMQKAAVMVFNSHFMHDAYRANAGVDANRSAVIYQGVDDETFESANLLRGTARREPYRIVSVSAMARHKGVETVVAAVARLRDEYDLPIMLRLIGSWPDSGYRREIELQVRRAALDEVVTFEGHVTREELHRAYAEAQVFCLMSWCESFGIPAVEAQAFGTPVVSSACCAIPEVCGDGGLFPRPGRVDETAAALARVLTEPDTWQQLSDAALINAERFRWDLCSRPYVKLFDDVARM